MASQMKPELGNLVRLIPLTLDDLPAHPAFAELPKLSKRVSHNHSDESSSSGDAAVKSDSASITRPSLVTFIKAILSEASAFIDSTVPGTFKESSSKSSPPASAKVDLLKRTIKPSELLRVPWSASPFSRKVEETQLAKTEEAWFARRSRHANHSEEGTADWLEFDHGLRVEHSEKERQYTPDVFDSYKVLDWDSETRVLDTGEGFEEVNMRIYEMCHKLPFPLAPRVFSVVVVTAKTGRHSLLVVQVPIDICTLPEAFYSNGRNTKEGDSSLKRKKAIVGVYTSIERARVLPDLNIEWVMGTASDAKGWLPMWAQKMGVPGAVIKDVGLFVKWVAEGRVARGANDHLPGQ